MLEVLGASYKCGIEAITLQGYGKDRVALFIAWSSTTTEAMTCARDWISSNAQRLKIGSSFTLPKEGPRTVAAGTTPIEFWMVGDDSLSGRFHKAVEDAIKASGKFPYSRDAAETSLFFYAPTNVGWKDIGGRTEVHYRFEFWTPGERQGLDLFKPAEMKNLVDKIEGTCWADEMQKCAEAVMARASEVAAKL